MKSDLRRLVPYVMQRGELDARPVWFRVLNGTPEDPKPGSVYQVINFNIGDQWQVSRWMGLN